MKLTKEKVKDILEHIKDNKEKLEYNENIFDIREGDLLSKLLEQLRIQLTGESSKLAAQRAAPINVLNKIIRKLSTLYANEVTRVATVDGERSEADQELVDFYSTNRDVNQSFADANGNFNSYKWTTVELFEDVEEGILDCRSVPSHQFIAYSDSLVRPTKPTAIVKTMGDRDSDNGDGSTSKKQVFFIYTDEDFIAVDEDGNVIPQFMRENQGENPFGLIPFTYINKSTNILVPKVDTDTLAMTVLIPLLIVDINFAQMYLGMPIIYGINLDMENLKISPNQFWNFKSESGENNTELDVLKPDPNIEAMWDNVKAQLTMWLETRDIKPGAIGRLTAENFASGIAKIISEMDTLENRKGQEKYFKKAEIDFWRRLASMHNDLVDAGRIENIGRFSDPENLKVIVSYSEDKVIESRDMKVKRLSTEVKEGFRSRESAIKALNPEMSLDEIKEEMAKIDSELKIDIVEATDGSEAPSN